MESNHVHPLGLNQMTKTKHEEDAAAREAREENLPPVGEGCDLFDDEKIVDHLFDDEKIVEQIKKAINSPGLLTELSALARIVQTIVKRVEQPAIAAVEAAGFRREDCREWFYGCDHDWDAYRDQALKEAERFRCLPFREYIKKLQEIESRLIADDCLQYLREREGRKEVDKCICTALSPRLTESYPASLNNYQSLEKILAMESGQKLTFQVGSASVAMQRLTGEPLTEADKMVLFATCHVAKNNTVLYPRLADAEHPKGKHVPFAGFLDVAAQMKGGKVRTGSGLYEAVVQSLARLTTSKYFFDYSDLVNSPDLKEQAISAEEQALIEGRRVIARANNGKSKEGIVVNGSWIMDFLARAGNPGVFKLLRKYLSGIRIDGPEDLEMFARILKRATNTAPHQNRQRLYAAGRPAGEQTFFKSCGLLDISTITTPTSSQTSKDTRQRQKLEGMLSCLKETGDFAVSLEREGRNKKLVAFEVRFLGKDQPTKEAGVKRKTPPRIGEKKAQN